MRNTGAAFGGRPIGSVFLIILYHKAMFGRYLCAIWLLFGCYLVVCPSIWLFFLRYFVVLGQLLWQL